MAIKQSPKTLAREGINRILVCEFCGATMGSLNWNREFVTPSKDTPFFKYLELAENSDGDLEPVKFCISCRRKIEKAFVKIYNV